MITSLLLDGVLKLVQIRKDSNKSGRTARVYDPKATVPEQILEEDFVKKGVFVDHVNKRTFKLTNLGLKAMA